MSNWKKMAQKYLSKQEDRNLEIDRRDAGYHSHAIILSDGDAEYIVYQSETDAEQDAYSRIEDDLRENPEYFNQDWLSDFIDENRVYEIIEEMSDNYANDIVDEESDMGYANRLIDEMVEWNVITEQEAKEEDAEDLEFNHMGEFVLQLTNDKRDSYGSSFDYLKSEFGDEEAFLMAMNNDAIEINEAVEDAVATDGLGHFMSSYDGEAIDLGYESPYDFDGLQAIAFRIN